MKCMRVEIKKSIEKFGAETENVFRKQNKKTRRETSLDKKVRKLDQNIQHVPKRILRKGDR